MPKNADIDTIAEKIVVECKQAANNAYNLYKRTGHQGALNLFAKYIGFLDEGRRLVYHGGEGIFGTDLADEPWKNSAGTRPSLTGSVQERMRAIREKEYEAVKNPSYDNFIADKEGQELVALIRQQDRGDGIKYSMRDNRSDNQDGFSNANTDEAIQQQEQGILSRAVGILTRKFGIRKNENGRIHVSSNRANPNAMGLYAQQRRRRLRNKS